jgi:hypothetical protein
MACGTAVVCTTSGTTDFARHLETALVVRWRHPFFVRRAVARALRDEVLRARLAAAGPAAAAPWSWPHLAGRLLAQLPAGRPASAAVLTAASPPARDDPASSGRAPEPGAHMRGSVIPC